MYPNPKHLFMETTLEDGELVRDPVIFVAVRFHWVGMLSLLVNVIKDSGD